MSLTYVANTLYLKGKKYFIRVHYLMDIKVCMPALATGTHVFKWLWNFTKCNIDISKNVCLLHQHQPHVSRYLMF